MTTIAYRDGIMAGDSCWAMGSRVSTLQSKLIRLASGGLVGFAGNGDWRPLHEAIDKCRTPAQLPSPEALHKIQSDTHALLVLPKGRVYQINTTHVAHLTWTADFEDIPDLWEISFPYAAIGSGQDFAIGAMSMGASARDAVAVAARWDLNSKPPVHWLPLKSEPKK